VEEISWLLGHENSLVTRQVYVQEVKSAERQARQRAGLETRYGGVLASASEPVIHLADEGEVVPLPQVVG